MKIAKLNLVSAKNNSPNLMQLGFDYTVKPA